MSARGERESDLSDELKRLTGKQPVLCGFDPARRADGERSFVTGLWLVDDPGAPVSGEPYAVAVDGEAAFCAAITRALMERPRE